MFFKANYFVLLICQGPIILNFKNQIDSDPRKLYFCMFFTCDNENVFPLPDFDDEVGDNGWEYDNETIPGDWDQPLELVDHPGPGRLQVSALAPVEVFDALETKKSLRINSKFLVSFYCTLRW